MSKTNPYLRGAASDSAEAVKPTVLRADDDAPVGYGGGCGEGRSGIELPDFRPAV